tara:strand:- start:405 stop:554 length:150 start_codon:yes stop_codon:yes gene_type:complete
LIDSNFLAPDRQILDRGDLTTTTGAAEDLHFPIYSRQRKSGQHFGKMSI